MCVCVTVRVCESHHILHDLTRLFHLHHLLAFFLQMEDIKANMDRRKAQLQKMLAESQDKVARHLAGEQVFDDQEVRCTFLELVDIIDK